MLSPVLCMGELLRQRKASTLLTDMKFSSEINWTGVTNIKNKSYSVDKIGMVPARSANVAIRVRHDHGEAKTS